MKNINWRFVLAGFLVLVSPFVYYPINSYISCFVVPLIFSLKSMLAAYSLVVISIILNAMITAILTALPCGYLVGKKRKMMATFIIITLEAIPAYNMIFHGTELRNFSTLGFLGQFMAIILSVFIFAEIGFRMANKGQNRAAV